MKHAATHANPESRQPVNLKTPSQLASSSRAELAAMGEALRDKCSRNSHAEWKPSRDRPDPLRLIEQSDQGRIPELVPIRHGRMLQSPFIFYRAAALNMAADLASTPTTGVRVQACGDAHLVNFRGFATPERRVQFDIHDLDETLPAPWEWDVKRLAASFVLTCRDNGLGDVSGADAARACARSYREHMIAYGKMPVLDVWYASLDVEALLSTIQDEEGRRRVKKRVAKAREQSALEHDFPKLAHEVGGSPMIRDNPPTIYHWRGESGRDEFHDRVREAIAQYRESLRPNARVLLDRFEFKDMAIKVVGVGSVGTFCAVVLLMAGDKDPLFLQVKEARASVLEAYAGKSVFANHGERCVNGHRLMQSASDIFLGWTAGKLGRHFYVRQLNDMKLKPMVEQFNSTDMIQFGEWCGWTLARAHARSGEPAVIGGYLGKSDTFDKAIAAFSIAYADQTERDYELLKKAAQKGKLEVVMER
ncbi:DUF2252 domain-containing protein [Tunturiibacter gelidiferens]|uniref:DUF2252 domain-containing protein n=1 Tax=Tunturiibacter gelidiferens TaxID=3069689 RepID=UPI003D9ADCE0